MFHTEGYLDRQTYVAREHITAWSLQKEKSMCYFWCVWKEPAAGRDDSAGSVFLQEIEVWFYGELVKKLGKGRAELERELERLGRWLGRGDSSHKAKTAPFLCLYYRGQIYMYGDASDGIWAVKGHRGIYLWHRRAGAEAKSAEEGTILQGTELFLAGSSCTLEELANSLQAELLKAMSAGTLEKSFFFIWEDRDDF